MKSVRRSILGAVLAGATMLGSSTGAQAVVYTDFEVLGANSFKIGDSLTAQLQLSLTADAGYFNAVFTGGQATLFDGLGGSKSFNIGTGGTARLFDLTSIISSAGTYVASFVLNAIYAQTYNSWEVVRTERQKVGTERYKCGFFTYCTRDVFANVPVYGNVQRVKTGVANINLGDRYNVAAAIAPPIAAVPVPAALPMLAAGLGALGFMGLRKKRKATAAA